jgi:type III pantothenate kinase
MNLVIDIGNTSLKAAVFRSGKIIASGKMEQVNDASLKAWLKDFPDIHQGILSSVRKDNAGICRQLEEAGVRVRILDDQTPLPLVNRYRSPKTLGRDRLAAAVGANAMFPGQNLLVIDAGTAITIDFVSSRNEYLGGNISPGLAMRFRALREFTDNLPAAEPGDTGFLLADHTEGAIRAGVQYGIIFELDEYINRLKNRYPDLQVVLTGGDARVFDKKLKNSIFVDPDLNLHGLNRILEYNVDG